MDKEILDFPVQNTLIDHPFGEDNSNDPIKKDFYRLFNDKHPGVDFPVPINTPVYSAFSGIVVRKEFHGGMGNVAGVRNGNIIILYAHLKSSKVKLGQIIKRGDLIGYSGNTGETSIKPHLHFEVRDITKPTLAQMVLKPEFGKSIKKLKSKFTYCINNSNTPKTLYFLAIRYFGNVNYWRKIKEANNNLNLNPEQIIPDDMLITIPNYT